MSIRNMSKSALALATVTSVLALAPARGATLVQETFDYASGTVDGTQAGGTGMTGAWDGSTTDKMYSIDAANPIDVSGINGLSASAGKLQRNSAPGHAQISRGLDSAATTGITADDSTVYFSILLENNRYSTGNANDSFIISTDPVPEESAGDKPINIAGGEGFGVVLTGENAEPSGSIDIRALAIDDGTGAKSTGLIDDSGTGGISDGGESYFVVGQIDWLANGSDDTLTLYNVTDTTAPLPAAFATITADIDNSNIDTLAFAGAQIGAFDELRIGESLGDVGAIPEPASLALLGLAGALLLRRRR